MHACMYVCVGGVASSELLESESLFSLEAEPAASTGNSERGSNVVGGQTRRMDSQRAAGQGDAKAHSKTHRAPYGRPQAP